MQTKKGVVMEFHVSRGARDRYQISETLFSLTGNVIFSSFHDARLLAHKMNDQRDLARFPEQTVKPGHINTMGLIDEILHFVAALYREQVKPSVMAEALDWLQSRIGTQQVDATLRRFVDEFPPVPVYKGAVSADAYLAASSDGVPHRQLVLEEMLLLWLANENPAFARFLELFDDSPLKSGTAYNRIMTALEEFFAGEPAFGPKKQPLIEMLRSPALAVPHSLAGQLQYIRENWAELLDKHLYRLLRGLDLIKEEEAHQLFLGGTGPEQIYQFNGLGGPDAERFSPDREWMPQLVLMAKNAYVWLDQLSRKYQRPLHRLNHIPDEELDTLARWGFSGLWLIGLWERSRASQQIKQLCGNPEAVASAYSLFDYQIADDLGGEEAYQDLRGRAWRRGIRLASDMVPNHMGIDSRWVIQHPDWFISLDHPPFPSYSFGGPDLSRDGRVGIFIEDHYYTRTDASVVFKRSDRATGGLKYIYHGNDGTSMPWNDTAQLDYTNPEVREAVIQTILHVARKFPIIRFDAAMTLTRQHYQRLWFPEPGTGGAIPTRSEHGLTKEQFDALMPREFWQEVVERVAQEVPDTLLLAEAFWMTEGYFVRTLGMHRVYNSAFMNMLKKEENANYRLVMKNTLQFNPEILKRFVNFMNNPDEETAVAQFGKGDKYFGICTMMVTLPGLPVYGHGQIEGLTEKYGMEYRRAYRDEQTDWGLVQRHEREIFPLVHRRRLFAEVEHFLLYDFVTLEGRVNEDVFAYSNRCGEDRALVVYHNAYATARGWIKTSVSYAAKTGNGDERAQISRDLGTGLGLHPDHNYFCIFRDHVAGLEYIRNSQELFDKGLRVELGAYRCHVFVDFREVRDNDGHAYTYLAASLAGKGAPSIDEALKELFLQPIQQPFKELVNAGVFRQLMDARPTITRGHLEPTLPAGIEQKIIGFLRAIKQFTGAGRDETLLAREIREKLSAVLSLLILEHRLPGWTTDRLREPAAYLNPNQMDSPFVWSTLFGWAFIHALGKTADLANFAQQSRSWLEEWQLGRVLVGTLQDLGLEIHEAAGVLSLVKILTTHQRWFADLTAEKKQTRPLLESLLRDGDVQQFLKVNRFQDVLWFNKEAYEELLKWLYLLVVLDILVRPPSSASAAQNELLDAYGLVKDLRQAGEEAEYQVERLLLAANHDAIQAGSDSVRPPAGLRPAPQTE